MLCTYKKKTLLVAKSLIVVHPGLEPRLADPESDVLPLHQWTIPVLSSKKGSLFLSKAGAKVLFFFQLTNIFFQFSFYHLVINKIFFILSSISLHRTLCFLS